MMTFKKSILKDTVDRDPYEISEVSKMSITIDEESFSQTIKNLNVVTKVVSYTMARAIGYICVHLLANAQPRVPMDTGELRRSGRVDLLLGWSKGTGYAVTIAKGLPFTIESNINNITRKIIEKGKRAVTNKIKGSGEYYAKWPGTGPKYLELPFLQYRKEYINILRQAATNDCLTNLRKITRVIRKKNIEIFKLEENRIDTLGYYTSVYNL